MRQLEGEHIAATEAREQFADLINRASYSQERIILTRRGKPIAAIVPVEDVEWLEDIENEADLAAVGEAKKEIARDGSVSLEEVLQEFGVKR